MHTDLILTWLEIKKKKKKKKKKKRFSHDVAQMVRVSSTELSIRFDVVCGYEMTNIWIQTV